MVDMQRRDFLDARFFQQLEILRGQLVAGLDMDLARLLVDDVDRDVAALEVVERGEDVLDALFLQLLGQTRRDLRVLLGQDLAGLGVDKVGEQLRPRMRSPSNAVCQPDLPFL